MKSNKKNDKKESATQQLLNLKQFVPLQIGDNGAVAIEGEDGMLYTYIMLRPDNISVLGRSEVLAKIRNLQNILSDVPSCKCCACPRRKITRITSVTTDISQKPPNPPW